MRLDLFDRLRVDHHERDRRTGGQNRLRQLRGVTTLAKID